MADRLERMMGIIVTMLILLIGWMMWEDGRPAAMQGLIAGYLALYALREFIPYFRVSRGWPYAVYCVAQWLLAFGIVIYDGDFISQVFLFVLVAEVSFRSFRAGAVMTLVSYLGFAIGHWIHYGYPSFEEISYIFPRAFEYLIFFGISSLARLAVMQRQQLGAAYERLAESAVQLERQTILRERTRVSRELHDTMGHTLLAALTGVKASRKLMGSDPALVGEMLEQTQEQLVKGLREVRQVVELLQEERSLPSLLPAIEALIRETERQMEVTIDADLPPSLPRFAPKVEMALYRALQEGLTNGVRHGKCGKFDFLLELSNDMIVFQLDNDGLPWREQPYGFGLTSMQERVRETGGTLSVRAGKKGIGMRENGMSLRIAIPFKLQEDESELADAEGDYNQSDRP
ncbi:sensor histidine kinase [Paenibacillus chungangensis]|uniref:histidine kinase n=1 Tax=Paenibacillus chungangensis TaxID=696535 RepID=A0ABW3HVY5_9BACL